jgi:hypothetical protein
MVPSPLTSLLSVVLLITVALSSLTIACHAAEVEVSPLGDVVSSNKSPSASSKGISDDKNGSASAFVAPDPQVLRGRAIFDWINGAEDGFMSDKQTVRRADQDDITSHIGVFATENIQKGELLAQIPWDHIIKSDNPSDKGQLPCGTGA